MIMIFFLSLFGYLLFNGSNFRNVLLSYTEIPGDGFVLFVSRSVLKWSLFDDSYERVRTKLKM
jgi:hypothetical protein